MNEIETIFCKLLKCGRGDLYLDKARSPLGVKQLNRLEAILKSRVSGQPLQYLIGDVEFMGLRIKVKEGVLIPRPETEILVERAVEEISAKRKASCSILDIGTGSGNIAIALAKFLKGSRICAIDLSDICLSAARANAMLNRVASRITFLISDLFACFKEKNEAFDFIVSNPPYIAEAEMRDLPESVRREPGLALLAKEGGLYFYSRIEKGSRKYLKEGGMLFLEIGDGQGKGISEIFSDRAIWKKPGFFNDLAGIERVAIIERQSNG